MTQPSVSRLTISFALAALTLAATASLLAACTGLTSCPMAGAETEPSPAPAPCHAAATVPAHDPPQRLAADDCCAEVPPALPVAVNEVRAPQAPEAPVAVAAGSAQHAAGAPGTRRPAAEIDTGPPLAASKRLSLLQTFLI